MEDETPVLDEEYVTIVGVVATTHAIPGRSVRLSLEALEDAREQLLAGVVATQIEHDSRDRLEPTVTGAEIRQGDDGEFSLAATMAMSTSDYQRLGGRTAYSVAFPEVGVPGWPSPLDPIIVVMVDSYHWDDAAILDALEVFSDSTFPVEGARYHQFAGEPPAKVVFDLLDTYKDIPLAILAAYMVECVKVLFKRRKKRSAEHIQAEVGEEASDVEKPDSRPVCSETDAAEPSALPFAQSGPPTESARKVSDPVPARVTLEFRAGARHAAIDCDGSETSERLVETVIRALADVTPISGEQEEDLPTPTD